MEERTRKPRAYDSAQSRRQEYKNACRKLQRQCFQTYEKLREIRQQKERYRRIFLGTPGILQIVQQVIGFEQYELERYELEQAGPEGFQSKKPWLEVHWERLCGFLEELEKKPPLPPMSESQYAYNLNLDWERLDSPERKRLRRRLVNLLEEETRQLSDEEQDEEYTLFRRLSVQLTDCLGELNQPCKKADGFPGELHQSCGKADEPASREEAFCQWCVRLRTAFYEERVRFIGYEETDDSLQGEWFQTADRGGRLPCVIWETDPPRLLLYGREEAGTAAAAKLKESVAEYIRLREANQRKEELWFHWQDVEDEVSKKLAEILELMKPGLPNPEPDGGLLHQQIHQKARENAENLEYLKNLEAGRSELDAGALARMISHLDSMVEEQRGQAEILKQDAKFQFYCRLYELLREETGPSPSERLHFPGCL